MRGLIFALVLGLIPGAGMAGVSGTKAGSSNGVTNDSPGGPPRAQGAAKNGYTALSDEELTGLAAEWDSLDRHQRRALLTEMRVRMARNGKQGGVIRIRTERRYGRIIRQADGRVIRIETQVVHVRPADPDELEDQRSFGLGFEQRVGDRERPQPGSRPPAEPEAAIEAPAVTVQSAAGARASTTEESALNDLLESLEPSTRAPGDTKLPIYKVSDPES